MPIIPSGFGQATIPFTLAGYARPAVITYGFQDVLGVDDPSTLADIHQARFETNLAAVIDSTVTIGPTHVQVNPGAGVLSGDGTTTEVGGSPDERPPPNVALLVRKGSLTPGRRGRGRLYLPWAVTETAVNEQGSIDGGTVDDFQEAFNAWLAGLTTDDVPMVILHTTAGSPATVTSLSVQNRVATQRRRLRP